MVHGLAAVGPDGAGACASAAGAHMVDSAAPIKAARHGRNDVIFTSLGIILRSEPPLGSACGERAGLAQHRQADLPPATAWKSVAMCELPHSRFRQSPLW